MNILLSCVGRRSYIVEYFREALAGKGLTIGTSNITTSPAFRFCDKRLLVPGIFDADYIPTILSICKTYEVRGLFSFLDHDVDILSKNRQSFLDAGVAPFLPSQEASHICLDKAESARFLKANGFTTPLTFTDLTEVETALAAGKLCYPVIVKPRFGFGSRNIYVANNDMELRCFFNYSPDMIVQEKILGEERDFEMFNDLGGQPLAVVPWKKLGHRAGESDMSITIEDPRMLEIGEHLSRTVGQWGPLDADVIFRDGEYHIIEMNPRFGGGYPVSHLAGGDFPGMAVRLMRGEVVAPRIGDYRREVLMMKDYCIQGGEISGIEKYRP
jgi:carbamoyl-phosphate synthase large subunit